VNNLLPIEIYNTNLSADGIQAIGTVEFDQMNDATVSIMVNGQMMAEKQISAKEFEVLSRYFDHIARNGVAK
jgi:hypothetical protein